MPAGKQQQLFGGAPQKQERRRPRPRRGNAPAINEPNFPNRTLWNKDNLDVLRGMASGCVNLIYGDPPFNSDAVYQATPGSKAAGQKFDDRWSWGDAKQVWLDLLQDDWPEIYRAVLTAKECHSQQMGGYIAHMAVRLVECHRILRPDGSIYIHCDPTASPYLRTLMDGIFGRKQFRNEITWKRTSAHSTGSKRYGNITDSILFYAKTQDSRFYKPRGQRSWAEMQEYRRDAKGRLYKTNDLTAPAPSRNRQFEWRGTTPANGWRYSLEKLEKLWATGRIKTDAEGRPLKRGHIQYLDEMPPPLVQNLWIDIDRVGNTAKERTGWSTQKPEALLERVITASSKPNDLVFDPWCSCATTMAVAEKLGRRWAGCDYEPYAIGVVVDRLSTIWLSATDRDRLDEGQRRLFVEQKANLDPNLPIREPEDIGDELLAAPEYHRANLPAWQCLSRQEIYDRLAVIQSAGDSNNIQCPACGNRLHRRYFHLDHRIPKTEGGRDDIGNRMLLCGPCNGGKGSDNTISGLHRQNLTAGYCAPNFSRKEHQAYVRRITDAVELLKMELG